MDCLVPAIPHRALCDEGMQEKSLTWAWLGAAERWSGGWVCLVPSKGAHEEVHLTDHRLAVSVP